MAGVAAVAGLSALLGASVVVIAVYSSRDTRNTSSQKSTGGADKDGGEPVQRIPVVIDVQTRHSPAAGPDDGTLFKDPKHDPRIFDAPDIDPRREINIPTRGAPPGYQQIGYLSSEQHGDIQINNIVPLFGRRTYNGSNNWNYYTRTEAGVKIPLSMDGRDCSDDIPGCKELYDDDRVNIDILDGDYKVKLYNVGAPRYIPYV